MLYDQVQNRSSISKADTVPKHVNNHTSPELGKSPMVEETEETNSDITDASAFNAKKNEQADYETGSYITNSTSEVQGVLTFLSDRLKDLQKERESAELLGISGSVKAVNAEISLIRSRIGICKERHSIIAAGYELWNRIEFRLTCENGGFLDIWETIGEVRDAAYHSNPESEMRIPLIAHEYFREAINSGFFTTFLVCAFYEDWDLDELGDHCNYYLFATPHLDDNSLFLIATWNSNDL